MRRRGGRTTSTAVGAWMAIVGSVLFLSSCLDNPAPGNDREAELEPPAPPAPMVEAGAAIDGVDPGLLMPEIMTDADQSQLGNLGSICRFRMTRIGFPVAVYGSSAVLKLNGRLVTLAGSEEGRFASDGVEVTIRPLEARDEQFAAELILRVPGGAHELGFHGYSDC